MKIFELSARKDLIDQAIEYFWKCWGNEHNFKFYQNCIQNSLDNKKPLPKFYIALHGNAIIASYALLTNDIISRQDLYPWLACLFVNPAYRNQGIAGELLEHGLSQTKEKGFTRLYLSSDLKNFYEKKGWEFCATAYNIDDSAIQIYSKPVEQNDK